MRTNTERRTALLDAAIELLAELGARGLTLRAVDARAAVPVGTTSNYFANRDDLLVQAGTRVYQRLRPEDPALVRRLANARSRHAYTEVMRDTVARIAEFRAGYLALLELRLEATRRPGLRALLTERVRADIDANIAHHEASGLPGDATAVRLLYLALNWLIVEQLTLPDVFSAEDRDELIAKAVARIVAG
ncbi:TetR/AcrR family transcriptional regulator [Amycolatopsis sp. NPDC059027]|uniref:TetR/AcrR family transcriptional regulator n=1 Tax=unclassified Amycolatopsis TaxID=2618356 RepID=UPI00366E436B